MSFHLFLAFPASVFIPHLWISLYLRSSSIVNYSLTDAYCNNSFPRHQGEVSALINLARTLEVGSSHFPCPTFLLPLPPVKHLNADKISSGFAVAYFQVPWATKNGAIQTFGVEAAYVHYISPIQIMRYSPLVHVAL